MHNKIGYIKIGSFSHTNQSFLETIKNSFPEYQIEIIDIKDDILNKFEYYIINPIMILIEYPKQIFIQRKCISDYIYRTPYIFKKIKRKIKQHIDIKDYIFTVQTQSLFDASVPGLPHYLYTDHTHLANLTYPFYDKSNLASRKWIDLEKQIYHNATINFTMSSNISKSIIEQYNCPENKVKCIYAGSNTSHSLNAKDDKKYTNKNILFVGIDWERKGGPDLVQAFRKVLNVHRDASLTIVGCMPTIDNLPNCNIEGRVPLINVAKYYKEATIFCLPTKLEPFGMVFIEAISYCLPIIATKIGAIPDFVTNNVNGYMINPGDIDDLADKIIDLLSSPDKCIEYGLNGHKLLVDTYNWQCVGEKIKRYIKC